MGCLEHFSSPACCVLHSLFKSNHRKIALVIFILILGLSWFPMQIGSCVLSQSVLHTVKWFLHVILYISVLGHCGVTHRVLMTSSVEEESCRVLTSGRKPGDRTPPPNCHPVWVVLLTELPAMAVLSPL